MKYLTTICILLLVISQSNAQVDSDSIPTYETAFDTYLFNHSAGKEDNLTIKYPFYNYHYTLNEKFKILKCNGEKCKPENKSYESVEFEYGGMSYIATNAELTSRGRYIEKFDGISYKLSGNALLEKQYKNGKFSHNNLYYPDGKHMEVTTHFEDIQIPTTTTYSNNGEIISTINLADSILVTDEKYGKYNRVNTQISSIDENYRTSTIYGIHPDAENESIITHSDGTVYRGYPFIGRYHNLKNYELVGYLGIANSQFFGGGTVCFLKDNTTGLDYWAVILDNVIVYKYDAKADETPDVEFLQKNTEIDFKNLLRVNNKKPRYNISDNHFLGSLLNMKTKNLNENFSGYGINITTEETRDIGYGNKRIFEVGVYKNGKLNGAGFRLFMDIDYYDPYAVKVKNIVFKLNLEAGKFENGLFVDGQKKSGTIIGEFFLNNDVFWLRPQPLENLDYSFNKKGESIYQGNFKNEDFGFDFKNLKSGNIVYSTAANRIFTVNKVDTINKKIILFSDRQKDIVFDANKSGDLIFWEREKSTYNIKYNCRHCEGKGYVEEKIYSNVTKSHTHETGEMYIETSSGLKRGTKKYTATWNEKKLTNVKKYTCPVCKGKKIFVINGNDYKTRYIPVLF